MTAPDTGDPALPPLLLPTDRQDKEVNDLGCAYVGIARECFNEAIDFLVSEISGRPLTRRIDWGRP